MTKINKLFRNILGWKPTIGIVGFKRAPVASLGSSIVQYGNEVGFTEDQHFPEILSLGINCENKQHFIDQVNICYDFGCDIIISPEEPGKSGLGKIVFDNTGVKVAFKTGDESDLVQSVFKALEADKPTRRPNLLLDPHTPELDGRNIKIDRVARNIKIRDRSRKFSGYPLLNNISAVGVLGGAGPMASAVLCEKLAEEATDFIHYSVNSAPGKHNFEMGDGPSYIPHYLNAVDFLKHMKVQHLLIPCNTAHMRLEQYCGEDIGKVIDIRSAVLEQDSDFSEGVILLGTNRTVGIGLPDGGVGIYEEYRSKKLPNSPKFIIPSEEEQKKIMEAIFDVKAGRMEIAQEKITSVVTAIRERKGDHNIPVILGCTELPLPFKRAELRTAKLIDPAEALAARAGKMVVKSELKKEEALNIEEMDSAKDKPKTSIGRSVAASIYVTAAKGPFLEL